MRSESKSSSLGGWRSDCNSRSSSICSFGPIFGLDIGMGFGKDTGSTVNNRLSSCYLKIFPSPSTFLNLAKYFISSVMKLGKLDIIY